MNLQWLRSKLPSATASLVPTMARKDELCPMCHIVRYGRGSGTEPPGSVLQFDPNVVVDGEPQLLLAPKVFLGGLDADMS